MAIPAGMKFMDGKFYRPVFRGDKGGTQSNAEKVAANIQKFGISAKVIKKGSNYYVWRED
jgi:hypothetical protein